MIFGAIYEYPYQPLMGSLYGWGSGYVFIHNTFILNINNTSYSINSITQNCILKNLQICDRLNSLLANENYYVHGGITHFSNSRHILENIGEYEFLFLSEKQKNIFENNMKFFEDYYVLGFDTMHEYSEEYHKKWNKHAVIEETKELMLLLSK